MNDTEPDPGFRTTQISCSNLLIRVQIGHTHRQLADKLGKPQNYVGCVETEQRRLDFIELLAWLKACGVDAEEAVMALAKRIGCGLPTNGRIKAK